MNEWWNLFARPDQWPTPLGIEAVLLTMLLAVCLGHVIGWVYMGTHTGLSYSQTFVASLAMLPALVALTMLILTGDMAIAIGLLAIFAIVRFRNVLKDTRDTTFVLWSILQGMALGTQRFGLAVTACVCVALFFVYLRVTSFGSRHRFDVVLSLQSTPNSLNNLGSILRRHSLRVQMASQRDSAGERVDVSYRLLLRNPSRGAELVRELQTNPGYEQVTLFERRDENEV
ncbi:MAG: DUF4956 domain-containing protein [Pirellulales bacterium]